MPTTALVLAARIERRIHRIRDEAVMLDSDLALLYHVTTRALVQAIKRNRGRFPPDFMFRLTKEEAANLRSQIVISSLSRAHGGRRHLPYVFTEQGVAMLSSVLKSPYAARVNVEIMRAFVRLRRMLTTHSDLARKLDELEQKCDKRFRSVFNALRELMAVPPDLPKRRIGFQSVVPAEVSGSRRAAPGTARSRAGL